MKITVDEDFVLENREGKTDRHFPQLLSQSDNTLRLRYDGVEYSLELTAGHFDTPEKVCSDAGVIELRFC